jgi:hypothetical protein
MELSWMRNCLAQQSQQPLRLLQQTRQHLQQLLQQTQQQ